MIFRHSVDFLEMTVLFHAMHGIDHVIDHVIYHVIDHVIYHAIDHVIDHVVDHVIDHALSLFTYTFSTVLRTNANLKHI